MRRRTSDDRSSVRTELSVAETIARIRDAVPVDLPVESIAVAQADGRVLAADVSAPIDLPPFDNAALDGYAVRAADCAADGEVLLPVRGRITAGAAAAATGAGSAVRIFTGAPMPTGFDAVVMQENARAADGRVAFRGPVAAGHNRRRAGEDVARGQRILTAGTRLGARHLALAAALGLPALPVRARLRVALFSTGDELEEPGTTLRPAAIHDANRPALAALLARLGAAVTDLGILRDAVGPLRTRLAECARDHDLIVTSGGVSVGEEDHVRAAVEAEGALAFWRLAIRPGRPVAFGSVAGTPFIGLPGNPAATYVTGLAILRPLVLHLAGAVADGPTLTVRSGFSQAKPLGRRDYLRVRIRPGSDGAAEAHPATGGALAALAASDGLVELPEEAAEIRPGDLLRYHPHDLS